MSSLEKFLAGWRFRSRTPTFESGVELVAYVTDADGGTSVLRIGDSRLELDEHVPEDAQVRVRVTAFDDETHRGEAELLDVLGTATF
ncbi:DUF7513 family protein [Halorientalis regularis]|jgi:hypothetical protein|uniref:DUF7513 domain-containing protein n=1 Tax=Halorientalis regularis TaxID=660518 RepID=A0A1G7NV92_9EURY|nr:hypothetical protein [Halorientalis regularis]SDF77956.1 hypothetical protein SAMN05216218_109159 [Halorientalis regularis]